MRKVPALITLVADACHCGLRQGAVATRRARSKAEHPPLPLPNSRRHRNNGNRGAPWHARATASRYGRNSGCTGRDGKRNRGSRGGRGRLTGATGFASRRCLRPRNVLEVCRLALTTRSLVPAQPTSAGPGKVEVVEVFWYGCGHCFALDPAHRVMAHQGQARIR